MKDFFHKRKMTAQEKAFSWFDISFAIAQITHNFVTIFIESILIEVNFNSKDFLSRCNAFIGQPLLVKFVFIGKIGKYASTFIKRESS